MTNTNQINNSVSNLIKLQALSTTTTKAVFRKWKFAAMILGLLLAVISPHASRCLQICDGKLLWK